MDSLNLKTYNILINILHFTEWPKNTIGYGDFLIGIVGDNFFKEIQSQLEEKQTKGRRIRFKSIYNENEIAQCHVLFIEEKSMKKGQLLLKKYELYPILTISNSPNFFELGGMVKLVREEKRLYYDINLPPAEKAHLTFHAGLLQLARKVYQ